jgi:coenzyme F420 hydrogenase subunit beta
MRNTQLKTADSIASWRLCAGCGVCAVACPEKAITLIDVPDQGIRPVVDKARCLKCSECVKVCPGIEVSHQSFNSQTMPELRRGWGPVLQVWEGYTADPEIRYKGSSGGVATTLALFCLETKQASGVLHIGVKSEAPLQNVPVFSKTKEELLACTGSRYSPAAPCERFDWIEKAETSCVFIGKPCDVVALRKSQAVNQVLNEKVFLAISIFCAGTPSTSGTVSILETLGVTRTDVAEIRYRGCGWPGKTAIKIQGSDNKQEMTYEESWGGILSKHVPLRCRLCPDGTGEFADISCGDPWYRQIEPGDSGRSLVLVRTERGREILRKAMEAGYVELETVRPAVLAASQRTLLKKRQMLFGRLAAMRMMFIPTPKFEGFSLLANWYQLPWADRLRSILGTIRRIITRGWLRAGRPLISDTPKNASGCAISSVAENADRENS